MAGMVGMAVGIVVEMVVGMVVGKAVIVVVEEVVVAVLVPLAVLTVEAMHIIMAPIYSKRTNDEMVYFAPK